jgi:hypothetical protein
VTRVSRVFSKGGAGVTWTESQVLRWLSLPMGTSIICIAQKPQQ